MTPRDPRLLASMLTALLVTACGSSARAPEEASSEATSGEEALAPTPPPSFLPAEARVLVRADLARVRRSPIASELESTILATPTWQSLAGGTGVRPVSQLDALLIGADGIYADRRVGVLRYVGTEGELRERLLEASVARSIPLAFREVGGFAVTPLPVALPVEHSIVLTAAHEAVICPSDDVERVVAVARDHAARRAAGGDPDAILEPQLALAPGEMATLSSSEPMPGRAGYPTPPTSYRLHAMEDDASHHLFVYFHGEFQSEAEAQAALDWALANARRYASDFLVRGAGLARPLEALTGARAGAAIDLQTDLSSDEARRLIGAMTLLETLQGQRSGP